MKRLDSTFDWRDHGLRFADLKDSHDPDERFYALCLERPLPQEPSPANAPILAVDLTHLARSHVEGCERLLGEAKDLMEEEAPEGETEEARKRREAVRDTAQRGAERAALQAPRWAELASRGVVGERSFVLSGGSPSLENKWKALAMKGAAAAGLISPDDSDELMWQRWLVLLREGDGCHFKPLNSILRDQEGKLLPTGGGHIERLCTASVELCDLLETEAYVRALAPDQRVAARVAATTGNNIDRLSRESGLSHRQLAAKLGVQKKSVIANVKGKAVPRRSTLKLYADVFSSCLDRKVTVSEISGEPDS